jgi:hypothetical protein
MTWVGGEQDQYWGLWGRRRVRKFVDRLIYQYKEQNVSDFEVGIFDKRGNMLWYSSSKREREGLPPLEGGELREAML